MSGTTIERQLKKYEGLIRATTIRLLARHPNSRRRDGIDDYISEARIAAWKAIRAFNVEKHVKIETLIICSVRNHLATVDRALNTKKRTPLTKEEVLEYVNAEPDDRRRDRLDRLLDIEDALYDDEFDLVRQLAQGRTLDDLARERSGEGASKSVIGQHRLEIERCLRLIQRRLQLRGLSQSV